MKQIYGFLASGTLFSILCFLVLRYSRKNTLSFLDSPASVKRCLLGFYAVLAVLLAYDFFVHKHDHIELGNAPEFFAVYGFISCVVLIFGAKLLRLFVKRDENYYDKK